MFLNIHSHTFKDTFIYLTFLIILYLNLNLNLDIKFHNTLFGNNFSRKLCFNLIMIWTKNKYLKKTKIVHEFSLLYLSITKWGFFQILNKNVTGVNIEKIVFFLMRFVFTCVKQ